MDDRDEICDEEAKVIVRIGVIVVPVVSLALLISKAGWEGWAAAFFCVGVLLIGIHKRRSKLPPGKKELGNMVEKLTVKVAGENRNLKRQVAHLKKEVERLKELEEANTMLGSSHRMFLQFLSERTSELSITGEETVAPVNETFIKELQGVIEENLSNPVFSVAALCKKLCVSSATLYRKVFYLTGKSPQMFIRSYRLEKARQLLKANLGNVTEVCFKVGFTSTAYFTKCFKEKYNQLPSTLARQN